MEVLGHPYRMSSNVFHRTLTRQTDLKQTLISKKKYDILARRSFLGLIIAKLMLKEYISELVQPSQNSYISQKMIYMYKTLLFVIQTLYHSYKINLKVL